MTLCTTLLMSTPGVAQKPAPTINDLIPGGATYRFAENLYGVQWWGDSCVKPDIDHLFIVNTRTGQQSLMITREQLNKTLEAEGLPKLPYLNTVEFPWADSGEMLIFLKKKYIIFNLKENKATLLHTLPDKAANIDFCNENRQVAYTVDNNLYIDDRQITQEPDGIICGQSVHRSEFGINKGTFWSPKGNLMAFYRMDESMVTQYPLVDITTRIAEVNNIRYPMAGMTSHKVTVGIYDTNTQTTIYLNAGDPTDRYFTNISWSPDEKSVYLIELNRDQNHSKLCQYDATTGSLMATLIEEKHPKYVEPQHPITFLPWDATKFIYQSQQDGYNHLYLYNTEGKLIKQLTSGAWLVKDLIGFNKKSKCAFIQTTELSPLQSNIYRLDIPSGKRTLLGTDTGVHQAKLSPSGTYFIDTYTAPDVPRSINIIDTQKGKSINLLTAENPFKDFEMPTIETGTIKAADGVTDLYYRMVKPADFDPNKKYPTVVYVYGGPHAQMITNGFQYGARGWDLYMPTQGFIMFTLDNRGSSNRGLEFENCTFRNLGIEECKDQVKGIEYLKTLPYIDAERIGVHGWSYGGHMTTALLLRHPDIFKVGVAGGPVIDWKYYEIMYGERYMDTPESNPEGYEQGNLNNLAGNLKGHLLIIHDDHDDTCVPQHTLSFMKACVDAGTYPDLFIYPGHKHNVIGRDRVHLHEKITRYFAERLR
nr:S9 family peptidase [Bacteroides sp. 51]